MKNLMILTYWSYKDALIQAYTLPYVRIIRKNISSKSKLYLFTLEQRHLKMTSKEWSEEKLKLSSEGIYIYRFPYAHFGLITILRFIFLFFRLLFICITKKISRIHAWCTPAGAIGYFLSKFTGIPLIIDSFEPHAEPMLESNTWKKSGIAFKLLFKMEKLQARRAEILIFCVENMKYYSKEKYNYSIKKYFVKPACVDFQKFNYKLKPSEELIEKYNLKDSIICVYSGKFGDSYLTSEIFDFFKVCYDFWGNKFKALLISSTSIELIHGFAQKSKFPLENIIKEFVDFYEVPQYLTLADFALTPFKPVPSKRYGSPIKDGEYWAMGLPVVITPNISDDSEIIYQNKIGSILKSLDTKGYLESVKEIDFILKNEEKSRLKQNIRFIAEKYRSFKIADDIYREIYAKKLF